jgi:DNA-binding CsgD family transcriptional regulator/tetratricopeptide (TPR) repeat protein
MGEPDYTSLRRERCVSEATAGAIRGASFCLGRVDTNALAQESSQVLQLEGLLGGQNTPFFAWGVPRLAAQCVEMVHDQLAMHLFERQQQLERLNQCLQGARAGSGKVVLVAGEAGIGKSSLVERFVSEHRRDVRALWGACDALATPRALAPIREIAAQTLVLGGRATRDEESLDRLFQALLEDLAQPERASVVVLEDLHWADEATLDCVRFIGRRIQRTSAVFVVTYRDDEISPRHPVRLALGDLTGDHIIRMRLAPLSPVAVADLAKESGREAARLYEITGGNPFFVREVLASLDARVPETVRDAVVARLERCAAPARELAQLVSMSPARTETWLVESILGSLPGGLSESPARGLLDVQSESVGFRHELARLAVYSIMPSERVRAMHDEVLQVLIEHGADHARLVHHATLAQNATRILEYAPLAAQEAARVGSHREAAAHLSAALRYSDSLAGTVRSELLEQHARECHLTNQTAEAISSATAAVACWRELGNVEAQSRVLSFLSEEYRAVGEKARADECVASAIALLEPLPAGATLAVAYCARSALASHRGWDREALEFGQRALSLAREIGDHATESHALALVGAALLGAGDLTGYEPLEQSITLALEYKLEEYAARAYRYALFYSVLIHDFARAGTLFREGVAYCEERGIFRHSAYMRAYYTPCELDMGNWTEASRMAAELLRGGEVTGVQQRATILATLALVRMRRGDPGVDELLDEAFELALPTCELNRIGRVTAARAEHAWYLGEIDRVAHEAAIGLAHVEGHTAPWIKGELLWWQSRAQVIHSIPDDIAEPYRLMLGGDCWDASSAWKGIGMPYEQALALAEGPEEALRESLTILDRLGAGPMASIVRRRLREGGARNIPRGPSESTRANPAGLTEKEVQVLQLLAQGFTNAQIARRLHRSTKTVDHHVSAVLEKLGVRSRAQAVAAAVALGIVQVQTDNTEQQRPDTPTPGSRRPGGQGFLT